MIYKSYRSICSKVKIIFYDDKGIIQKPTDDQRKLAIYDDISIKCLKCNGNDTYVQPGYSPDWRKYRGEDNKQEWDGKSFLCKKCYSKIYSSLPESQCNIIKRLSNLRVGQLAIHSKRGKGLIAEAVIAKIRKLEIIGIKSDNFNSKIDLSFDLEYGIIQVKSRISYYGDWMVRYDLEEFDTLFVLCLNKDGRDIERMYAVPERLLYGTISLTIMGSCNSKYEKYRIDERPYNDVYHNLMEYLRGREYFGIEDIIKWLSL